VYPRSRLIYNVRKLTDCNLNWSTLDIEIERPLHVNEVKQYRLLGELPHVEKIQLIYLMRYKLIPVLPCAFPAVLRLNDLFHAI